MKKVSFGKTAVYVSGVLLSILLVVFGVRFIERNDPEKTDCYGETFPLQEGDVILVRVPGSTVKRGSGIPDPPTNLSEDTFIKTGSYPYLSFPR